MILGSFCGDLRLKCAFDSVPSIESEEDGVEERSNYSRDAAVDVREYDISASSLGGRSLQFAGSRLHFVQHRINLGEKFSAPLCVVGRCQLECLLVQFERLVQGCEKFSDLAPRRTRRLGQVDLRDRVVEFGLNLICAKICRSVRVHSAKNKHHGDSEDENSLGATHSWINPCASLFSIPYNGGDSRASLA